jgi:plastocyanin
MKNKIVLFSVLSVIALLVAACQSAPAATKVPDAPTMSAPVATAVPEATQASAPASGSGAAVEIVMQSFAFSPETVTIPVGTEVKWTNMDSAGHNVVSDDGTTIKSPKMALGESWSMVFDTPGTYTYICGIHPSMNGTVVVTK